MNSPRKLSPHSKSYYRQFERFSPRSSKKIPPITKHEPYEPVEHPKYFDNLHPEELEYRQNRRMFKTALKVWMGEDKSLRHQQLSKSHTNKKRPHVNMEDTFGRYDEKVNENDGDSEFDSEYRRLVGIAMKKDIQNFSQFTSSPHGSKVSKNSRSNSPQQEQGTHSGKTQNTSKVHQLTHLNARSRDNPDTEYSEAQKYYNDYFLKGFANPVLPPANDGSSSRRLPTFKHRSEEILDKSFEDDDVFRIKRSPSKSAGSDYSMQSKRQASPSSSEKPRILETPERKQLIDKGTTTYRTNDETNVTGYTVLGETPNRDFSNVWLDPKPSTARKVPLEYRELNDTLIPHASGGKPSVNTSQHSVTGASTRSRLVGMSASQICGLEHPLTDYRKTHKPRHWNLESSPATPEKTSRESSLSARSSDCKTYINQVVRIKADDMPDRQRLQQKTKPTQALSQLPTTGVIKTSLKADEGILLTRVEHFPTQTGQGFGQPVLLSASKQPIPPGSKEPVRSQVWIGTEHAGLGFERKEQRVEEKRVWPGPHAKESGWLSKNTRDLNGSVQNLDSIGVRDGAAPKPQKEEPRSEIVDLLLQYYQ